MVTGADAPSKRTAPPTRYFYLDEQMSTGKLIETLEGLHFNSQGLCRINVDEGTRNYLLRATRAAGGDPGATCGRLAPRSSSRHSSMAMCRASTMRGRRRGPSSCARVRSNCSYDGLNELGR